MILHRSFRALIVLALFSGVVSAAGPASAPSALYERIASEYLDGKCDELEADLAKNVKEIAALPAGEKAEVNSIRLAMMECRPFWWKTIKKGQKVAFEPLVWGRTLKATYDPAAKGVSLNNNGTSVSITIGWTASEMDDPAQAEHGFTKGELCSLGVWMGLGMAESWTEMPLAAWANLDDAGKLKLQRYLDFRSNVAGVYYGIPRARRWGLWLWSAGYTEHYSKMPTVMGRKAVGAMFAAEVVGHPERYPSIQLPKDLPADGAEEKLVLALKDWIEKNGWTAPEDRAIRDALKAFAAANTATVYQTGKVTLANGLPVSLDPAADAAMKPKRDAWVKAAFDKINK